MKKYSKLAYLIVLLLIVLSGFFIYQVLGKNKVEDDIKSKVFSEIQHLESEFLNLFNEINNIKFENYSIASEEIIKDEKESNTSSESNSSKESNDSEEQSKSSKGTSGGSNSSSSSSDESVSESKQFKLEKKGVLTGDTQINWELIKNDVEKLYSFLYTTTLDLYQVVDNQEDVLNFNREYDNLTKAVKEENKEATLIELSNLYNYLSSFVDACSDDQKEKTVIKTKNEIFKAYSTLEQDDWESVLNYVNSATQEFTKLVTNIDEDKNGNQYNINKTYIMLNELQNAVALKDKEVFLIKYKNVLEELQNV